MADSNQISPSGEEPGTEKSPQAKHERIKGVFSTQVVVKVGTGTTTRKTIQKMYWFVGERSDGILEIQQLNKNYVPSGPKKSVAMEDLLQKFSPEPEFYVKSVYPKMRELEQNIANAEQQREKGELFSAELSFNEAIKVDEENVRANFGLGLTYLERGESSKADDILERLVKLEAAFAPEHKHMFNDFGINLRKNKMFDQAVNYYRKAEELASTDENLFYNIARAYFEKGEYEPCREYLSKALEINPDFEQAGKFLQFLRDKNLISASDPAPEAG